MPGNKRGRNSKPMVRSQSHLNQTSMGQSYKSPSALPRKRRSGGFMKKAFPWIVVLSIFAILYVGITSISESRKATSASKKMTTELYNPAFKARYADLGRSTLIAWYNNGTAPITLATGVSWPGGSEGSGSDSDKDTDTPTLQNVSFVSGHDDPMEKSAASKLGAKAKNPVVETLKYTAVYNGSPTNFTLTICIPDIDDPYGLMPPILLSSPTVEGSAVQTEQIDVVDKPGPTYSSATPGLAATQQLETWAKAWATNDMTILRSVTLDPDSTSRYYQGLGNGWQYEGPVKVNWSYRKPDAGMSKATKKSKYMVAEVEFPIYQNVLKDESKEATEDNTIKIPNTQTMDVLISGADSGLPAIVSWGPQGSWRTLSPYSAGTPVEKGKPIPVPSESSDVPSSVPSPAAPKSAKPSSK